MEPKKFEDLTEEQKFKMKKLIRSHMMNSAFSGFKVCTLLLLANLVIVLFNQLYIHSQVFALIGGVLNAIFILPILSRDNKKERDRLTEEYKKIVSE